MAVDVTDDSSVGELRLEGGAKGLKKSAALNATLESVTNAAKFDSSISSRLGGKP